MKKLKSLSFALTIYGLLFLAYSNRKKNVKDTKSVLLKNNLSNELVLIEDSSLENVEISSLLNERGFLKSNFDSLNENEKLNYSLIHGYI